jgi:acyl-CoA thioesterase FadM
MGTPFTAYRREVPAEWLDYNGHMHDASYAIALSEANEKLFAALDLSADYRVATGAAYYTVETRIRFLAECKLGQTLTARTTVLAADAKRLRLFTELVCEGEIAATGESLYLHVDPGLGKTTPLSADRLARVESILAAHGPSEGVRRR